VGDDDDEVEVRQRRRMSDRAFPDETPLEQT
jgi:hypothetical protein